MKPGTYILPKCLTAKPLKPSVQNNTQHVSKQMLLHYLHQQGQIGGTV